MTGVTKTSNQLLEDWVSDAITYAKEQNHKYLLPIHFLKTLQFQQTLLNVISSAGGQVVTLVEEIDGYNDLPAEINGTYQNEFPAESVEMFSSAREASVNDGYEQINIKYLLVELIKASEFNGIFASNNVDVKKVLHCFPSLLKPVRDSSVGESRRISDTPVLDKYSRDLTQEARDGKLDAIVGRDDEIRNIIQMLSLRSKHNPVLVGQHGVGKTSIMNGLAIRIANDDVPTGLKGKRLVLLSLTQLATASNKGGAIERFKSVLGEVKDSAGDIILALNEFHLITSNNGLLDTLKPMLVSNEVRIFGIATPEVYAENVEKDSSYSGILQKLKVSEPSVDEANEILRGVLGKFEKFHKVSIVDSAVTTAVALTARYVPSRCLPDKAIDVVDQASARLRMQLDSTPTVIDETQREYDNILTREISVVKIGDEDEIKAIAERKASVEARLTELRAKWENEIKSREEITAVRAEIDSLNNEAELALNENDFDLASEIQYERLPDAEARLNDLMTAFANIGEPMIPEAVGDNEVASIVEKMTGVPVSKLLAGESEKLVNMEERIGARLIGQKSAVEAVSNAVRRSRAGVNDPKRPTGSFMFLGSSGTGKSELSKALAEFLFDDENAMIRFDMSEFSEKHSVARLIGAPPGYVGYESGGELTGAVRERPYSVILLDEVEKAHPDIFDIFLSITDEGRLKDSQGRSVDFRNTIIVLTSNLGSQALIDDSLTLEEKHEYVMDAVRGNFRPEFLNRLDEMVIFDPLSKDELGLIVDIQVNQFAKRLSNRKIKFTVTDEAKSWLTENGYDPAYGARPLRRLIQKEIGDKIALKILSGDINDSDNVFVNVEDNNEGLTLIVDNSAEGLNKSGGNGNLVLPLKSSSAEIKAVASETVVKSDGSTKTAKAKAKLTPTSKASNTVNINHNDSE